MKAEQKREKVIDDIVDAVSKRESVSEVVKEADLPFEVDTKDVEEAEEIIDEVREEAAKEEEEQVEVKFTDLAPEIWDHEGLDMSTGSFKDDDSDAFAESVVEDLVDEEEVVISKSFYDRLIKGIPYLSTISGWW